MRPRSFDLPAGGKIAIPLFAARFDDANGVARRVANGRCLSDEDFEARIGFQPVETSIIRQIARIASLPNGQGQVFQGDVGAGVIKSGSQRVDAGASESHVTGQVA